MDEISIVKKVMKGIFIVISIWVLCLLLLAISLFSREGGETVIFYLKIVFYFILGLIAFIALVALICKFYYKMIRVKNLIITTKQYFREISQEYTPAMVSILYDLKVEVYKDYTATIIDLCIKGYLKLKPNEENQYEILTIPKDISNLKSDEEYVYSCFYSHEKFDGDVFKKKAFSEVEKLGLIKPKEERKETFQAIIAIIIGILIATCVLTSHMTIAIILAVIMMVSYFLHPIFYIIDKESYKRTANGKQEAKKCKAMKMFFKDYTLIQEKEINYYNILEENLAYALALGEADKIEKTIKEDNQYRRLIYQNKI